jgi:leucine-zipper of insertion element IS481
MAHLHARLTHFGRLLLVQRITELGWPPPRPPRAWGVSWLARDRTHGQADLADPAADPTTALMPCRPPRYGLLRRQGMNRLAHSGRVSTVAATSSMADQHHPAGPRPRR